MMWLSLKSQRHQYNMIQRLSKRQHLVQGDREKVAYWSNDSMQSPTGQHRDQSMSPRLTNDCFRIHPLDILISLWLSPSL